MPNPFHLPAGRPEGGQFTFTFIGSLMNTNIPWDDVLANPRGMSDEVAKTILRLVQSIGIKDVDLQNMVDDLYGKSAHVTKDKAELKARLKHALANILLGEPLNQKIMDTVEVASKKYGETLLEGGQIKMLANDDGSYTAVHLTNDSVNEMLGHLDELKEGQVLGYNHRTGTARKGAFCVPVGKPKRVKLTSSDRSLKNRAGETARSFEDNREQIVAAFNEYLSDPSSGASRELGTDDFAGRISSMVYLDDEGYVCFQPCVLCEQNERQIANHYAEELGSEVMVASRPDDIMNPIGTNTEVLHTYDFNAVESDSGQIAAGENKKSDKLPEGMRMAMFNMDSLLKKARSEEYKVAHGGQKKPGKTKEQKQHEKELAKARYQRNKQAKIEQAAGREPIKKKVGWVFQGEKGYEEAYRNAVPVDRPSNKQIRNDAKASAGEAIENETNRIQKKQTATERKQRQRQREATMKQAKADGKSVAQYKVGRRMEVAVEGTPEYAAAIKDSKTKIIQPSEM